MRAFESDAEEANTEPLLVKPSGSSRKTLVYGLVLVLTFALGVAVGSTTSLRPRVVDGDGIELAEGSCGAGRVCMYPITSICAARVAFCYTGPGSHLTGSQGREQMIECSHVWNFCGGLDESK